MKVKPKEAAVIVLLLAFLALILLLEARRQRTAELRKILFELGEARLKIKPWEEDQPREFFVFSRCQKIRAAGFEPIWRDDRYILKDLKSGKEFDFLRMHREGLKLGNQEWVRWQIPMPPETFSSNFADLWDVLYREQLDGRHLVVRDSSTFLFVRKMRKNDREIKFEQMFLKDVSVIYNVCVLAGDNGRSSTGDNEALLKEHGFIMKRRGDGYVPVSLETGAIAELPSIEGVLANNLAAINTNASDYDYLARRRFDPTFGMKLMIDYRLFGKELLDLYGIQIRWNKSSQGYEKVE